MYGSYQRFKLSECDIVGYNENNVLPYLDYKKAKHIICNSKHMKKAVELAAAYIQHPALWNVYEWPEDYMTEIELMAGRMKDTTRESCLSRIHNTVRTYISYTRANKTYAFCELFSFLNPYLFDGARVMTYKPNQGPRTKMPPKIKAVNPKSCVFESSDLPDIVVDYIPNLYKDVHVDMSEYK